MKYLISTKTMSVITFALLLTLTFGIPVSAQDAVAHYSFDSSVEDKTGNFGEGETTGNRITKVEPADIQYSDGVSGQALELTGDYGVKLPDNLITDDSYTVSIWINPNEITQFTTTFFAGVANNNGHKWLSIVPSGPFNTTMVWAGDNPYYDGDTGTQIPVGEWTHLAFTVNGGEIKIYLDGSEEFSGSGFPNTFSDIEAEFALGVNHWDTPFNGLLDELQIFDEALSSRDIRSLAR